MPAPKTRPGHSPKCPTMATEKHVLPPIAGHIAAMPRDGAFGAVSRRFCVRFQVLWPPIDKPTTPSYLSAYLPAPRAVRALVSLKIAALSDRLGRAARPS